MGFDDAAVFELFLQATEAEQLEEGTSAEEILIELSTEESFLCVFMYLCAVTTVMCFLLWVARCTPKAEPLGVFVGEIPAWRSTPVTYGTPA